jgi:hypothetical protein
LRTETNGRWRFVSEDSKEGSKVRKKNEWADKLVQSKCRVELKERKRERERTSEETQQSHLHEKSQDEESDEPSKSVFRATDDGD